jgi:hypothetical protein
VDGVPDLRGLAGRLVRRVVAAGLGVATSVVAACVVPRGSRHGSELAPLFLIVAMAVVFAAFWSVLLDAAGRRVARWREPRVARAWVVRRSAQGVARGMARSASAAAFAQSSCVGSAATAVVKSA